MWGQDYTVHICSRASKGLGRVGDKYTEDRIRDLQKTKGFSRLSSTISFYRQGNGVSERSGNLPKVTQLVISGRSAEETNLLIFNLKSDLRVN